MLPEVSAAPDAPQALLGVSCDCCLGGKLCNTNSARCNCTMSGPVCTNCCKCEGGHACLDGFTRNVDSIEADDLSALEEDEHCSDNRGSGI